jgi:ribosome biogenesis GTPase
MAAAEPRPDWYVVDRYLAAAELMDSEGIVVFNKTDIQAPTEMAREILTDYERIGYTVIQCSAKNEVNLESLSDALRGKTAIIVGQSGVGKSSIINRLIADADQRTRALSDSTGEGRHTTVNSVLLNLPLGGAVIDSPGVRDYAPTIDRPVDVNHGFREIFDSSRHCRFTNCIHLREPNCAVKEAVENRDISPRRYESYKRLMSSSRKLAEKYT